MMGFTSLERQRYMLDLVIDLCKNDYKFDDFEEVSEYFKNIINILKQMNYCEFKRKDFEKYQEDLNKTLKERSV